MQFETNFCPIAMSIRDAAAYLGVGRTKVYDLINRGLLDTIKIDRRTLVLTASIHALVTTRA